MTPWHMLHVYQTIVHALPLIGSRHIIRIATVLTDIYKQAHRRFSIVKFPLNSANKLFNFPSENTLGHL